MSERVISSFLISKLTHFKIQSKGFKMLNLVSKCAQYWQKASIHELSNYKL